MLSALEKKLKIHIRFGTLLAATLLSTLMLTTIDVRQNLVFAQNSTIAQESTPITPAPETSDSDDDSSSSSDSNDESAGPSDDDDSNADNNNDLQDTSSTDDGDSSSDDGDSQDTSSSEEEDDTEDDSEPTNPLLEQIRNSVNGALSASGMPGPGF